MAAKKGKKKSRKGKQSGKKGSKKKGAKKKSRSAKKAKAPKAAASTGPRPVTTGKGPAPVEVAKRVTEMLRAGKLAEVEQNWLAPGIESVEGVGASLAWKGKPSVLAKYRAWEADHQIHTMKVDGPWVGATGFAVKFAIDVTQRSTGQRSQMEEIAVYTVRDGKIAREEFHFAVAGG